MKRTLAALTAIFSIVLSGQAVAEDDTSSGNYWLMVCKETDLFSRGHCLGFVYGVHAGLRSEAAIVQLQVLKGDPNSPAKVQIPYCLPENVSKSQVKDVYVKYLQQHPEKRQLDGAILAITALLSAFPCK